MILDTSEAAELDEMIRKLERMRDAFAEGKRPGDLHYRGQVGDVLQRLLVWRQTFTPAEQSPSATASASLTKPYLGV